MMLCVSNQNSKIYISSLWSLRLKFSCLLYRAICNFSYIACLVISMSYNFCYCINIELVSCQRKRLIIWWQLWPTHANSRSQIGSLTGRRITRMESTHKLSLMLWTWSWEMILRGWKRLGMLCFFNCVPNFSISQFLIYRAFFFLWHLNHCVSLDSSPLFRRYQRSYYLYLHTYLLQFNS